MTVILKGRNIINIPRPIDPGNPGEPGGSVVKITVTFAGAPGIANSTIPTFKFNKSKGIALEFDDAAISAVDAFEKLQSTFYNDGCGNQRNYAMGLAVNGRNQFNDAEIGDYPGQNASYVQRMPMILKGLDIMNHSYYHEPEGNFNYGSDRDRNIKELDDMILEKEKYKMNCLVVPTSWAGFHTAAANYGYIGGSSEGVFDTFPPTPEYNPKAKLENIPKAPYVAIKRGFTDNWTMSGSQWELINELFAGNEFNFFEIGTHGINQASQKTNFNAWIDSVVTKAGNSVMFGSLREFLEYTHLRNYVNKTDKISGNQMVVTLDYTNVPNQNLSWHDLSLVISSSAAISSVKIDRSDFALAYNPATKLINITKRKTVWP
ncbi:hypothetical protein N180_02720 [Pedobacter antarcticus 4BY]|uniref:NodB homology domain-containing protein n=2 Tax=Pedobacter antarcticus TaxID=34086 RepID=A0A081PKF5_9SPHI|nr:hypothetical protein [Pedobacter antarcticus]KEQ31178.1 hypothetical protein N180_02720 [Pedobacter antarcticus 4BY]SFE54155.1 hypothetical protein SAMN03003324_00834 [Pedobacter antarcticus]